VESLIGEVHGKLNEFGGQWLVPNLEAILTNMKPTESVIIEFPNQSEVVDVKATYDLLNNVPILFSPNKLYFAIQGKNL
jgi:uncharacterized protein (DUF1330 family)